MERLPSLSFRRWNWIALTEPSGAKRGMKKQVRPSLGLRQHQERVAHRRRHEPFVPGDAVAVAVALGARHVGAHVGAALLLGHAHAERHAALGPPRRKATDRRLRVAMTGIAFASRSGCDRQRRDRGARHGDRAEMAGLDLRGHVELRRAHHFGRAAGRLAVRGPGRIVHAGMRAECAISS